MLLNFLSTTNCLVLEAFDKTKQFNVNIYFGLPLLKIYTVIPCPVWWLRGAVTVCRPKLHCVTFVWEK